VAAVVTATVEEYVFAGFASAGRTSLGNNVKKISVLKAESTTTLLDWRKFLSVQEMASALLLAVSVTQDLVDRIVHCQLFTALDNHSAVAMDSALVGLAALLSRIVAPAKLAMIHVSVHGQQQTFGRAPPVPNKVVLEFF